MWLVLLGPASAKTRAGAAAKRCEGGPHGVAARCDVVDEVELAAAETGERCSNVVLVGRGRWQVLPVAGALRGDRAGAADRFGDLHASSVPGDVGCQYSIGAGAAGAVGDGDEPAWRLDERGHFASGDVEVAGGAARLFDGVGEAAGFGFGGG